MQLGDVARRWACGAEENDCAALMPLGSLTARAPVSVAYGAKGLSAYHAVSLQQAYREGTSGVTFFAAWKVHCKLTDLQVNSIPTLGATFIRYFNKLSRINSSDSSTGQLPAYDVSLADEPALVVLSCDLLRPGPPAAT